MLSFPVERGAIAAFGLVAIIRYAVGVLLCRRWVEE